MGSLAVLSPHSRSIHPVALDENDLGMRRRAHFVAVKLADHQVHSRCPDEPGVWIQAGAVFPFVPIERYKTDIIGHSQLPSGKKFQPSTRGNDDIGTMLLKPRAALGFRRSV